MKAIQNGDGHVGLTARAYPIAQNASLRRGQVVKLSAGAVCAASAGESGALLGIAAESHTGESDVLNPRANGGEILVYDSPMLIFECPAPIFTASGGTDTTLTATTDNVACTTADAFNGGRVKLKKKGVASDNSDCAGTVREITDFASASGSATFTLPTGGSAGAGDEYYLFPPLGSAGTLALDQGGRDVLISTGSGCTAIKVVGWDMERNMLRLMAVQHSLGI